MSKGFFDDYDDRLLTDAPVEKPEELEEEKDQKDELNEYYELPLAMKSRSLIWSVISFVAGVLSLAFCAIHYISLIFSIGAIACLFISRRNLGFFEKYGISGLILGIMGVVCAIFSAIATAIGL